MESTSLESALTHPLPSVNTRAPTPSHDDGDMDPNNPEFSLKSNSSLPLSITTGNLSGTRAPREPLESPSMKVIVEPQESQPSAPASFGLVDSSQQPGLTPDGRGISPFPSTGNLRTDGADGSGNLSHNNSHHEFSEDLRHQSFRIEESHDAIKRLVKRMDAVEKQLATRAYADEMRHHEMMELLQQIAAGTGGGGGGGGLSVPQADTARLVTKKRVHQQLQSTSDATTGFASFRKQPVRERRKSDGFGATSTTSVGSSESGGNASGTRPIVPNVPITRVPPVGPQPTSFSIPVPEHGMAGGKKPSAIRRQSRVSVGGADTVASSMSGATSPLEEDLFGNGAARNPLRTTGSGRGFDSSPKEPSTPKASREKEAEKKLDSLKAVESPSEWSMERSPEVSLTQRPNGERSKSVVDKRRKRKRNAEGEVTETDVPCMFRFLPKTSFKSDSFIVNVVDLFFLLSTIATMVLIIASVHPNNDYVAAGSDGPVHPGAIAWYAILFVFTLFWMWVRMATQVQRSTWEVTDDVSEIVEEYKKSWMKFDVLFMLPFEFVFLGWWPQAFYYASSHHFIRYFRVLSLTNNPNPLVRQRTWFMFLTYCLSLFVFYDIIANIFWSLEGGDGFSFTDAVYWTTVTMTSVGYGDVVASGSEGRVFTCISCISGTLLMASLTAFATRFVTQRDVLEEELDRKKKMMHSMLNYYQIPWNVQKEVVSLFPAVLDSQNETQFKSMIEQLPVFVAEKIESYLRAKMLAGVPLFQNLNDPDTILRLSEKLEQRFVPPFHFIVTAGELGTEMFFLVRGIVEVIVPVSEEEDRVVATLRSGSFFGEIALIESTHRSATVQAMTGCELLVLQKMHFDSVVYHCPQLQDRLAAEVDKRKRLNDELAPEANFNFPPTPEGSDEEFDVEKSMVRRHIPSQMPKEMVMMGPPTGSTPPESVSSQQLLLHADNDPESQLHSNDTSIDISINNFSVQAVRAGRGGGKRRGSVRTDMQAAATVEPSSSVKAGDGKRKIKAETAGDGEDDGPAFFSVADA